MSTADAKEKVVQILSTAAVQKFGEERASSLQLAIQEMAQCLVAIAELNITLEEEPAFFS